MLIGEGLDGGLPPAVPLLVLIPLLMLGPPMLMLIAELSSMRGLLRLSIMASCIGLGVLRALVGGVKSTGTCPVNGDDELERLV